MFKLYRYLRVAAQLFSAVIGLPPHSCRFTPSCSHYCEQAINRFGVIRGGNLCIRRVIRCRPGVVSGFDPVPQKS